MRFTPTDLDGAFLVELEPRCDARGFFARTWCQREFEEHGLESRLVQCSMSHNLHRGTLRGMHYQVQPHEETKLVRCTAGAIHDVIVDVRPESRTYLQHIAVELSAANRRALYIPRGFAHGFQTLTDDCEVFYQMSEFFSSEAARGFRWNDPLFGIEWPVPDPIILDRDNSYADYVPSA
jgi:dTDP-4-dehydrorhamnose 3,5-epimerase